MYWWLVKLHVKLLIEDHLKEMQSTIVIMTLWVRWKNPVKLGIVLDSEDVEDAKDIMLIMIILSDLSIEDTS